MNKFWPNRPQPEGFSIEKLAKLSREKISKARRGLPLPPNTNNNFDLRAINKSASITENSSQLTRRSLHWANRDFDEYHQAA